MTSSFLALFLMAYAFALIPGGFYYPKKSHFRKETHNTEVLFALELQYTYMLAIKVHLQYLWFWPEHGT